MSATSDTIQALLQQAFEPESLRVEDESWKHAGHAGARQSGGGHFIVYICSEQFRGVARHRSHRMVYDALGSLFPNQIHALGIHISIPDS